MSDRLTEIKQRRSVITAGEWQYDQMREYVYRSGDRGEMRTICDLHSHWHSDRDGWFIAAAPADIDWLIAEVERLRRAATPQLHDEDTVRDDPTTGVSIARLPHHDGLN